MTKEPFSMFRSTLARLSFFVVPACAVLLPGITASAEDSRRISIEDYRDKMAGAWLGQMAGVGNRQ